LDHDLPPSQFLETLELSKNALNTQTYASDVLNIVMIEYFTRFIIAAAAEGYAAQALKILTESTAATKLLPLVIRLRIFLRE
jgi:hypothetical protein